eukprot:scaffold104010_cov29-Tisochrysis_lutea.AAC.4
MPDKFTSSTAERTILPASTGTIKVRPKPIDRARLSRRWRAGACRRPAAVCSQHWRATRCGAGGRRTRRKRTALRRLPSSRLAVRAAGQADGAPLERASPVNTRRWAGISAAWMAYPPSPDRTWHSRGPCQCIESARGTRSLCGTRRARASPRQPTAGASTPATFGWAARQDARRSRAPTR